MDSPLKEPLKVLAGIIQSEMELDDGQVIIYNQKYTIPKDEKLYIAISSLGEKAISNINHAVDTTEGMDEIQEASIAHLVQIDIMSPETKDSDGHPYNEARARKVELVMGLRSIYAQQQCDEYSIRIANIPSSWVDVSGAEGVAILTRYAITFTIYSIFRKTKELNNYYDTFQTPEVHVNE